MRIIAGRWRGRIIDTPPDRATRPTRARVREAWMSAVQFELPGARVLDLFAGSGALGIETLSRGAAHVTFVEQASRIVDVLRANVRSLGAEAECTIVKQDALNYVASLETLAFDLALADPPYGHGLAAALAERWLTEHFAASIWIEHGTAEALPDGPGVRTRRYGDTAITTYTAAG
ncbi:MAG: 16S rRNA (guanine(966)-N(2))-methyltransferase RsmD [Longimicrobiales bacterium]